MVFFSASFYHLFLTIMIQFSDIFTSDCQSKQRFHVWWSSNGSYNLFLGSDIISDLFQAQKPHFLPNLHKNQTAFIDCKLKRGPLCALIYMLQFTDDVFGGPFHVFIHLSTHFFFIKTNNKTWASGLFGTNIRNGKMSLFSVGYWYILFSLTQWYHDIDTSNYFGVY